MKTEAGHFEACIKTEYIIIPQCNVKDALTSIQKSDLLRVTMAIIHVVGQQFSAVRIGLNSSSNQPNSCEIRAL